MRKLLSVATFLFITMGVSGCEKVSSRPDPVITRNYWQTVGRIAVTDDSNNVTQLITSADKLETLDTEGVDTHVSALAIDLAAFYRRKADLLAGAYESGRTKSALPKDIIERIQATSAEGQVLSRRILEMDAYIRSVY